MCVFVIPEGLSEVENKPEPSFVYRSLLNYALKNFPNKTIFLMPANKFNFQMSEQKAGYEYLKKFGKNSTYINPKNTGYICTVQNISLTIACFHESDRKIAETSVILCGKYHLVRVWLICKLLNFPAAKIIPVSYRIVNEKIVARLWFYKHPFIHVTYEAFAILQSLCVVVLLKIRGF